MALDLDEDETVELDMRPSWLACLNKGFIIFALFIRFGHRYTVTDKRAYKRKGIIRKNETLVRISDIRDVGMKQSVSGRLLRYGAVEISTAGTGGTEIRFGGVGNPGKVRDRVEEIRRDASSDQGD